MRLGEAREEARRLSEVAAKAQEENRMSQEGLGDIPEEEMDEYGDYGDAVDVHEISEHIEGQEAPPRLRRTASLPQSPIIDPWTPLDINAPSTPKPIAKGKTVRLPPSILRKHAEAKGRRPQEVPQLPRIQDFLVTEMTGQMFTLPPGIT